MRSLKITESYGQFIVETSAGVRSTGASLESAIKKMHVPGDPSPGSYHALTKLFNAIPDAKGASQIGEGVAHA